MRIRELTSSDAAEFQSLRLQGLLECPSAFASSHAEEVGFALAAVAERLAANPQRCVVGAFNGERLVGMVGLQREELQKMSHKAFIWGMHVAPGSRRSGVGRALIVAALERARGMPGLRQVNLGVNLQNAPALRLYERCGFVPFGVERGFMLLDGELHDEVQMVHVLVSRA